MFLETRLDLKIPLQWAEKYLDSFLRSELHLSRSQIRTLRNYHGIYLNDLPVRITNRLQGGEHLSLIFPRPEQFINPEAIPLSIIYEDGDLLLLNKPAGQVVHPVKHYQSGTLANGVIHHWRETGQLAASFHPVHRLDRLTTGLILIAKSPWVHQLMTL